MATTRDSVPSISVDRIDPLIDDIISVRAAGIKPNEPVTIQVVLNYEGKVFASCGQFVADNSGTVDASRDASTGGTYQGLYKIFHDIS